MEVSWDLRIVLVLVVLLLVQEEEVVVVGGPRLGRGMVLVVERGRRGVLLVVLRVGRGIGRVEVLGFKKVREIEIEIEGGGMLVVVVRRRGERKEEGVRRGLLLRYVFFHPYLNFSMI